MIAGATVLFVQWTKARARLALCVAACLLVGAPPASAADAKTVATPPTSAPSALPAAAPAAIPEAAATEGMIGEYPHPPMDKSRLLAGTALVDALRAGGYVLYMRHAETGTVTPDCTTSNLTPRGERDAARVGRALKALGIPFERILSSPVCRVQGTVRQLGLGPFEVSEDLTNQTSRASFDFHAARDKLLATLPAAGKNVLLVSHTHGGNNFSQAMALDFGEIIVFAPDGKGARPAVARVRVDDWAALLAKQTNRAGGTAK